MVQYVLRCLQESLNLIQGMVASRVLLYKYWYPRNNSQMKSRKGMRLPETPRDLDQGAKDALRLFVVNKLGGDANRQPEIRALTVRPFSDGKTSGFMIPAVKFEGCLEVTPGYYPQHYNVQSIHVNSKGERAERYYKRLEEVPFGKPEFERALDEVWQAGYGGSGHLDDRSSPTRVIQDERKIDSRRRSGGSTDDGDFRKS